MENENNLRLQVYLARCNVGSRRKCEEFIEAGRVKVNGTPVYKMGIKVGPEDIVEFDNRRVFPTKKQVYIALNKPPRVICTASDPQGRPTAIDYLKEYVSHRIFSVGRLDFLSSGLILFTNDGDFSLKISHPSSEIEKEYLVDTSDELKPEVLDEFVKGIHSGNEYYKIESYRILGPRQVSVVLKEGKNREIRNLFSLRRIGVKRLHRLRIGPVNIKGLGPGQFRKLSSREVDELMKSKRNRR